MSATTADRSKRLLELAEARFGDELTDADRKLFEQTAEGEVAHFGEGDPGEADKWGADRVLKADRIRWLCTDPEAVKEVLLHEGVHIKGARIEGQLRLGFAEIGFPMSIEKSAVSDGIEMRRTHVKALFLSGTFTWAINADGLRVDHDVHMRDGFRATGEVRLVGATIGGDLSCTGGQFISSNGHAVSADGIKVVGGVFFDGQFGSRGEVRLPGASIGGSVDCTDGRFINPTGYAFNADGMNVEGGVFMRNGFEARGEVRVARASIARDLDCKAAHISNPDGDALNADGVEVEGGLFLRQGFEAEGEVRLLGARVGGDLDCGEAHFRSRGGKALSADRARVAGNILLHRGFHAEGEVRLPYATIGGVLSCVGGRFENSDGGALIADAVSVGRSVFLRERFRADGEVRFVDAVIDGWFQWWQVKDSEKCVLNLSSARTGTLWDEEASWPKELELDGLVYDRLYHDAPFEANMRVKWIRRRKGNGFLPQPYEQLAKVLKEMGHNAEARKILIAKAKDPARVKAMKLPQRVGHHILGSTIGYGYRPWVAVWWMLAFLVVGWVFFYSAFQQGAFLTTVSPAGACPEFNSLVYSLDTFVPLVDLHQAKFRLPTGWFFRMYLWLHIGFGWGLTTLLVVGLTGLVKKSE